MLSKTTLQAATLLFLSTIVSASKESADACFHAAEALNDRPEVLVPHAAMLEAYNSTCFQSGLCTLNVDESLKQFVGTGESIDAVALSETVATAPIAIKAEANFGGDFASHSTVSEYEDACIKAGGYLGCVDGILFLDGSISGQLTGTGADDTVIDIELSAKSFPYCFPSECEGEDLRAVLEDATRDAVMNVPDVKDNLTPTTEALINEVTFAQMCALSGLPTCQLSVTEVECKLFSSSSRLGYAISFLAVLISTVVSLW